MASCCSGDVPQISLKNLAFTVFFEKVICKATPDTVDIIRDIIDQQRPVRERCAKELHIVTFGKPPMKCCEVLDIFAALDCVLDEHFKSLKVCIPLLPAFESFSFLMAIITRHCPMLEDLQVDFQGRWETFNKPELYTIPPRSLLPCLRSLTLDFHESEPNTHFGPIKYTREPCDSLLSIIGKLCPVLTKLKIGGVCMGKMDIVALIVKAEMSNILFQNDDELRRQWSEESVLRGLRIPCEFLNHLCSTLKELILGGRHNQSFFTTNHFCNFDYGGCAFALRHLPKLEILDAYYLSTIKVVELLYTLRDVDQRPFEEAWRGAANRLGLDAASSSFTFFSGKSSLKRLHGVPLDDPSSLLAVLDVCSSISHVSFCVRGTEWSPSCHSSSETILKAWSNEIETVELNYSKDSKVLKMVLDIFGSNVKKLFLTHCTNIDMAYFASICTKLEQLTFDNCSFIIDDSEAFSRWTQETFLPKLTLFRSAFCCLGLWGNLIEKKSSLVHLSLQCCHIGTNAHNPRLDWSQLPQLWPQLESLEIGHCIGLTIAMVEDLIPRFIKLRRISVPYSLQNLAFPRKKMKESSNRSEETVFVLIDDFSIWSRSSRCLLQLV